MSRFAHPDEDVERVLREAEEHGWEVDASGKGYFEVTCGCEEREVRYVALGVPEGVGYAADLRGWCEKQPCW